VLAALFWYPFDFHLERSFARERLELLRRPPFHAYWIGSEYRALTEVLHKTVFLAPLGAALAIAVLSIRRRRTRAVAAAGAFLIIVAAAVVIELGQVLLPGKVPDSTDVLLMTAGGSIGFLAVRALRARLPGRSPDPRAVPPPAVSVGSPEA
jgi:glycopeptide antibiotics resistance protein